MERKFSTVAVNYRLPTNIERDITLAGAVRGTTKTAVIVQALELALPLLIGAAKPTQRAA